MKKMTTPSRFNEKWVESTLKKLTKWIAYKTYNTDLPASPEDIAVEAITYAIMPALEGKTAFPSSEEHLMRRARMIARWRIQQAIQKVAKDPCCESMDDAVEDEDGTPQEHSDAEIEYVMHCYYAKKHHDEMMAQGRQALDRLDAFLSGKGVSKRDIKIYKARSLYEAPTDLVCARYGIWRTNLYEIVCVINGIRSRDGRSLVMD